MTLTGTKKHVQVLERARLVVIQKVLAREKLQARETRLKAAAEWLEAHRKLFAASDEIFAT